ncbi:hypothetical protein [Streptomyces sp. WG-D5]
MNGEQAEQQSGAGSGAKFQFGQVSGKAVAIGDHSSATNYEAPSGKAPGDELTAALLEALRALRGELESAPFARTDATRDADRELAEAEAEIAETGQATPGLLQRLQTLVVPGEAVLGLLASAASVAEAVQKLVGAA